MEETDCPSLMSLIRQKVAKAIEPWASSTQRPPFSAVELVVMALAMSGESLTSAEVFTWISETFRYHRARIAVICWKQTWFNNEKAAIEMRNFHGSLIDVFRRYDVITRAQSVDGEKYYSISVAEADIHLRSVIRDPECDCPKTFDFFGLPAEIKDVIYDMVFGFPKFGLHVQTNSGRKTKSGLLKGFQTSLEPFEDNNDFETWEVEREDGYWEQRGTNFGTRPMSEILAPLTINRQLYNEAMPTFYRINRFHFSSVRTLHLFLQHLAPERRDQVADISFQYNRNDLEETNAPGAFELLGEIVKLRRLNVRMFEDQWTRDDPGWGLKKYHMAIDIPGLGVLQRLRGLEELTFQGSCPNVEFWLRGFMMKQKSAHAIKKGGNAEASPIASWLRPTKTTTS